MTSNDKYDYEAELKAAKRTEIERLWFAQEATNKDLTPLRNFLIKILTGSLRALNPDVFLL